MCDPFDDVLVNGIRIVYCDGGTEEAKELLGDVFGEELSTRRGGNNDDTQRDDDGDIESKSVEQVLGHE